MFEHIVFSIKRLLNDECKSKQETSHTTPEVAIKWVFVGFETFDLINAFLTISRIIAITYI